jgi:hypothetical protein
VIGSDATVKDSTGLESLDYAFSRGAAVHTRIGILQVAEPAQHNQELIDYTHYTVKCRDSRLASSMNRHGTS